MKHDPDTYEGRREIQNTIVGLPEGHRPPNESPTKDQPLKGNWFHSIQDGKLIWQGYIVRQWGDYVLVQTFSWMDGDRSCRYVLRVSDLVWNAETKTGFYLYGDHESFDYSYHYGLAYAAEQQNKRNKGRAPSPVLPEQQLPENG